MVYSKQSRKGQATFMPLMITFALGLLFVGIVGGISAKTLKETRDSNSLYAREELNNFTTPTLDILRSNATVVSPGDFFPGVTVYNSSANGTGVCKSGCLLVEGTDYRFSTENGLFTLLDANQNNTKMNVSVDYKSDNKAGAITANASEGVKNVSGNMPNFGTLFGAAILLGMVFLVATQVKQG